MGIVQLAALAVALSILAAVALFYIIVASNPNIQLRISRQRQKVKRGRRRGAALAGDEIASPPQFAAPSFSPTLIVTPDDTGEKEGTTLPSRLTPSQLLVVKVGSPLAGILIGSALGFALGGGTDKTGMSVLLAVLGFAMGLLLPNWLFIDGWWRPFVEEAGIDALPLLRTVYTLVHGLGRPIDEALRVYGSTWQERSQLARLIVSCPSSIPVLGMLEEYNIPSRQLRDVIIVLKSASAKDHAQQVQLLGQHLSHMILEVETETRNLIKRRALTGIFVGTVFLLPLLLLTVLAPAFLAALQTF